MADRDNRRGQGGGQQRQRQRQPQRPPIVLHIPEPRKSGDVWVSNARIELNENNQPLLGARLVTVELGGNFVQVSMDPQTGAGPIRLTFSQPGGFTVTATRQDNSAIRTTVYVYVAEETAEERRLRIAETRLKLAETRQQILAARAAASKRAQEVAAVKQDLEIAQAQQQTRELQEIPEAREAEVAKARLEAAQAEQRARLLEVEETLAIAKADQQVQDLQGTPEEREAKAAEFQLRKAEAERKIIQLVEAPEETAVRIAELQAREAKAKREATQAVETEEERLAKAAKLRLDAAEAEHKIEQLAGTPEEQQAKAMEARLHTAKAEQEIAQLTEAQRKRPTGIIVDVRPEGPAREYYITVVVPGESGGVSGWLVTITDVDHRVIDPSPPAAPPAGYPRQRTLETDGHGKCFLSVVTPKACVVHIRVDGTEYDREVKLEGPRQVAPRIDPPTEGDLEGSWWEVFKRGWWHQTEKQRAETGDTP